MAKIREHKDIETVFDPSGTGFTIKHLTGDTHLPGNGGAWFVNIPCGGGKSTSIVSLVKQKADEGILLETPTMKDADEMKEKLLSNGLRGNDIMVLHSESSDLGLYLNDPILATTKKIIITTHIRAFIDTLSLLLAYDKGNRVDVSSYLGESGVKNLLQSDKARQFWLIDELPTFIRPFLEFEKNVIGCFSYMDRNKANGIPVGGSSPKKFWHCFSVAEMEYAYNTFLRGTTSSFWKSNCSLNNYREKEAMTDINQNYNNLMKAKSPKSQIWHFLNPLITPNIKTNILNYDGTANIICQKKNTSKIRLAGFTGKLYCSPISFEMFGIPVERWLFQKSMDKATLEKELSPLIDELERQINSLAPGEKILFIAWMYMVVREIDPDDTKIIKDKRFNIISILQNELDKKGLNGRYEMIYRGSGLDKGCNKFQDFAAISFIGEWSAGKEGLKLINNNFGTKCPMLQYRLSMMVQAICRIRIRQHEGKPIKVFYSDDIDTKLMEDVYHYFVKNSDAGLNIVGIPVATKTDRTPTFIKKVKKLCDHDPAFLDAIKNQTPYTLNIELKDMVNLIPMKEKKSRAYHPLKKTIKAEYGVILQVGKKKK